MTAAIRAAASGGDVQRDLVERAQSGDHDAFEALASAAATRLDTAARLILRDPDRAKDAVQDALVRAWRDLPKLREVDRWEAWLHRLIVRSCIDELRRVKRRPIEISMLVADLPTVADQSNATAQTDEIERSFSRLDADQRLIVVLHYYLDMPLPEVASAAGIPIGTAKSRLHRALAGMRRSMQVPDGLAHEQMAEQVSR